jgi:transcriptional regulator with XRE-family HTH domain
MSKAVGDRIAQARREMAVRARRDIRPVDVARAVGVSGAAVSEWEAGKAVPRDELMRKLAAYLGVTPEFLRYGIRAPRVELTDEEIAAAMARSAARRKAAGLPPIVADETIEGPDVVDDPPPPKQAAAAGRKRPKRPRDAR